MQQQPGRHFLQIPGPTNTPLPILAAIAKPTIDHRGPEFAELGLEVLAGIRKVFKTENPVVIYPTSGTGAWEAALVNTLSPGDRLLMFETGWFSTLWSKMTKSLGFEAEIVKGDWRTGVDAERDRGQASARHDTSLQGGSHRPQRDFDRRDFGYRGGPSSDRPCRPPGVTSCRYHFVAWLDRLPAR